MKNKDRYMEYALSDYKYQLNILKKDNKELKHTIEVLNSYINLLEDRYKQDLKNK